MKTKEKQAKIKQLVVDMLNQSHESMLKNIDKVICSGAIDPEEWDEKNNSMILPKCIVSAILKRESQQYEGKGTSFEKLVKKEVNNIMYFI